jgi:hypothetical protein
MCRTTILFVSAVLAGMLAPIAHAATSGEQSFPTMLKDAPLVISARDAAEMDEAKISLAKYGYVERLTDVSLAEYALQRIGQKEQQAAEELRTTRAEPRAARQEGFFRFGTDSPPALAFVPSEVPKEIVRSNSRNYIIPSSSKITQVFSNTELGQLLVREVKNARLFAESTGAVSTTVAGFPVYVTTVKYSGGQWVTFVLASKDQRVLEIEVGTRIGTQQQKAALDALVVGLLTSP